jgi:hypothetical protein
LLFIFLINTFDKSVVHFHDAIFYHVRPMYLFSGRHGRDRMVVGNYLYNQCISPLTLWVRIPLRLGKPIQHYVIQVCECLAAGLWFSLGTLVSSTNKTDHHNITKILLLVTLNTITLILALQCIFNITPSIYS